ncbi:MAG TPA: decarboxylating 6-phosphogluconate dehydrogenase [Desulfurivibrionaceae bacterium]|nr:decarboxylating 6-phosphogluconate dehydrogenase [Desulfurivibrionaceae bacterium]
MKVGMVGLGRMGMNMARRLLRGGHQVAAWNRSPDKTEELGREGGEVCYSLAELVGKLPEPQVVWLMLPAGPVVEATLAELRQLLPAGSLLVEGGNSFYKDDIRRAAELAGAGLSYLDAGVSGGIWGLEKGYCTMVGGAPGDFARIEPLLRTLAPPGGYLHCGPVGAGHFVKMIHNGIEYGMMQAYGEGFALIEASPYGQGLDYGELSRLWNQGSVIRSWLLELLERAFAADPRLAELHGYVDDSGEGRWTVQQAVESGVSAPVITAALFRRFESRNDNAFENRLLAALRREFGGHAVKEGGDERG